MPHFRLLLLVLVLHSVASSQEVSWYKRYSGTISKFPISLYLYKTGDSYSGYYYYEKSQQPISLVGNDSSAGDGRISLTAILGGMEQTTETFTLQISGTQLTGQWQQDDNTKGQPISATEQAVPGLSFDMVYTKGSAKMRPGKEDSPEAQYQASSVWPRETTPTALAIRRFINASFGAKNSSLEIGKVLLADKKKYLEGYMRDNRNVADSDWMPFPSGYSLDQVTSLQIVYHSPQVLTLASFNYSYTGGAHGNYGSSYTSFDLSTNKPFTLVQILTGTGIAKLNKLLEKYFRQQYKVKAGDPLTEGGLFEDHIEANDNFYVTGKGIGFNYTPYEIGPYAMGEVNIFIPFTELNAYLQPGFRKVVAP